jgi:SAM-dependent methyltransferase
MTTVSEALKMEADERIDPFKESIHRYSELIHIVRYSIAGKYCRGTTLDIACGLGYGVLFLRSNSSVRYTGVDIDEKTIIQAKNSYGHIGFFSVIPENLTLPYDNNSFDTICSLETIEHIKREEQSKFYRELLRVLKPKGILVISTPNRNYVTKVALKKTGWNNPYHQYEFKTKEFRQFLLTQSEEMVEILNSFYLGLPYNVTGAIHKHPLERLFRKFPEKILHAIDMIDIRLGFLLPKYCNSLIFVIRKK